MNREILRGAMSQENVEVVRQFAAAYKEADAEKALALLDPHVVWINYGSAIETKPYVGHEGVIAWLRSFSREMRDWRIELAEAIDAGGDQVIALTRAQGSGRVSGAPFELTFATLITLLNGKIVRVQGFETLAQAREAAGLSE